VKRNLISLLNPFSKKRSLSGEKGVFRFAQGFAKSDRIALVNHLILKRNYTSYLEIGVRNKADMHNKIIATRRVSVDPNPRADADFCMTSNLYFSSQNERFDIIFIDGLHEGEQVRQDLENALSALNEGGIILLHDLNPPTEFHARQTYEVDGEFPPWNGTSWEGYVWHRKHSPNLSMCVVDTDWGVGIVERGCQKNWDGPTEGYEVLEASRRDILNLISVSEFLARY